MIGSKNTDQGLAGVAALIIFIALVLVGAITAAVILDVAGSLEQQAAQTGEDATQQIASTLQVYDRTAKVDNTGSSPDVTQIEFIIGVAPGTNAVNLNNTLITLTTNEQRYDMVAEGVISTGSGGAGADGGFNITEVTTSSGDDIIRGTEQKYNVTIKQSELPVTDAFKRGQLIDVTFTAGAGGQAFQRLRIPTTIDSSRDALDL